MSGDVRIAVVSRHNLDRFGTNQNDPIAIDRSQSGVALFHQIAMTLRPAPT